MRACRDSLRFFVIYIIYIYIHRKTGVTLMVFVVFITFIVHRCCRGFLSCDGRPDTYAGSQIKFIAKPCNHSIT